MNYKILEQNRYKIELLVKVSFRGELNSDLSIPNFAFIEFSRINFNKIKKTAQTLRELDWDMIEKYDFKIQWICDRKSNDLESSKIENWDEYRCVENEMMKLCKNGDIVFEAYGKHTKVTHATSVLSINELDGLFKDEKIVIDRRPSYKVLKRTEDRVVLLSKVGNFPTAERNVLLPNLVRIVLTRRDVEEFRELQKILERTGKRNGWEYMTKKAKAEQWIYDSEYDGLENVNTDNWETLHALIGELNVYKYGSIRYTMKLGSSTVKCFSHQIELKELEDIFGIQGNKTDSDK